MLDRNYERSQVSPLGWFMDHAQVTSVRLESEADDESF